jgi:uncharacterized protein YdeI (YjbR/CyaY-like superfamily)
MQPTLTLPGCAVPPDLAAALEATPEALHYFESLSDRRRQRFVLHVERAKIPEMRARRIINAVAKLRKER